MAHRLISKPLRQLSRRSGLFAATVCAALMLGGSPGMTQGGTTINVFSVEELYEAVNNGAHSGAVVVLAPGTYLLTEKAPGGAARPNGGRLELQPDMSLFGVAGERSAVTIDTSALPATSFRVSFGATGAIRLGRGNNSVEWLTVRGNSASAAGIETDLGGTPTTHVRIAHLISSGNMRGVDVRNIGATMAGRRVEAEIADSEFFGNINQGIRVVNTNGADGSPISVVMSGNRSHENANGCLIEAGLNTSRGKVTVRSSGDRFENNGIGCVIGAGIVLKAGAAADANMTTFEAHGSEFINNTLQTASPVSGGIFVIAAETPGGAIISDNTVVARFWGCKVADNQNIDFEAFGARSSLTPGTNNHATIELHGVSKKIDVVRTGSQPAEPTNTVTVIP